MARCSRLSLTPIRYYNNKSIVYIYRQLSDCSRTGIGHPRPARDVEAMRRDSQSTRIRFHPGPVGEMTREGTKITGVAAERDVLVCKRPPKLSNIRSFTSV